MSACTSVQRGCNGCNDVQYLLEQYPDDTGMLLIVGIG